MNNRIDQFTSKVLRFLAHGRSEAGSRHPDGRTSPEGEGKPQPVARVLDEAEDISQQDNAIVYSKFPRRDNALSGNPTEQRGVGRSRSDMSANGQTGAKAPEVNRQNPSASGSAGSLGAGWGIRPAGNSSLGAGNLKKGKTHCNDGHPAPESAFAEYSCTCAVNENELCGNQPVMGICLDCKEMPCEFDLRNGYCFGSRTNGHHRIAGGRA